jgi:hydrogenase nickel incorporation protein HypB
MCDTCGCSQPDGAVTIKKIDKKNHNHSHGNGTKTHTHQSSASHHVHTVTMEEDILLKNKLTAERNRGYLEAKNILTLNLVSSPGSGKTSILERTLNDLKNELEFYVIEGDQQTSRDADRIDTTGVPVIQVNTGTGCHLDSTMIRTAIGKLNPNDNSVLLIENVGNLVCPAMFDLGETLKVVIISTTEGDDKPLKYPTMFSVADICIINKTDLLPYVEFDMDLCKKNALKVNHHLKFFQVSATNGNGLEEWYEWIRSQVASG